MTYQKVKKRRASLHCLDLRIGPLRAHQDDSDSVHGLEIFGSFKLWQAKS